MHFQQNRLPLTKQNRYISLRHSDLGFCFHFPQLFRFYPFFALSLREKHFPLRNFLFPLRKTLFPFGDFSFPLRKITLDVGDSTFHVGETLFHVRQTVFPFGDFDFSLAKSFSLKGFPFFLREFLFLLKGKHSLLRVNRSARWVFSFSLKEKPFNLRGFYFL